MSDQDKARQTLSQLRARNGVKPSSVVPDAIEGPGTELWLRASPPDGDATIYKLEREWTP